MITKESALSKAHYGAILHCTVHHPCTRTIGPRGGIKENITECRVSGKVKTWKTRPNDFSFPVKHGMYENHYVDNCFHRNAEHFHFADECPLLQQETQCIKDIKEDAINAARSMSAQRQNYNKEY